MKLTEQLKEEHQAIKVALSILDSMNQKLGSGDKVNPEDLSQILDFIKTFADRCHHGKEEDLLFGAMEKMGISREDSPIGVMLEEHEWGRSFVRGMSEAVEKYRAGDSLSSARFIENSRNYIELLAEHIDKEDNILYPMAETHLPVEKQHELIEEFEKVEREKIGIGRHEELHKILHHLKEIYLEA